MSLASDMLERLRTFVFRRREERELDEELRFHLEMETARHERGALSPAEARRLAATSLGGLERTKDDVRDARGTRLLDDTLADLAYSLRTLRRSPRFTVVAVATLALGIGGTTAVFSAVDAVLLAPLPYAEPGQLVRLYHYAVGRPDEIGYVTPVHYRDYRRRMTSLADVAALYTYSETGADMGTGDAARRVRVLPITADYFSALRAHPTIGRAFEADEEIEAPVVILSRALWQQELDGDARALGRSIIMSGRSYAVVGVMPEDFTDPVVGKVDAWVPLDMRPADDIDNAGNHYLTVVGRLASGATRARAQAELDALGEALARQYPEADKIRARLVPLKDDTVGAASRTLEILLGAVGLVLLLVCVNVANLLLVRGSERVREFALRSALGARRERLVRQLLIESVTLAFAGGLAGLLVARAAMIGLVALGSQSIPRLAGLSIDPTVLLFSLVVSSLSAVLFGLAPALKIARVQPSDSLREHASSTTGTVAHGRLRSGLVVAQVALAIVLLVGTGLLLASVRRLRQVDLGVKPDRILVFELDLPGARYDSIARRRFYETAAEGFARLPGVRAAGGISKLPATGHYNIWGTVARTGPTANTDRGFSPAEQRVVSGEYFRAVGIPLVAGRLFDARDDLGTPRGVVVTRSLTERLFPGVDALGQRIRTGGFEATIVGVVGEVALDIEGRPAMHVYHAHRQWAGDRIWTLMQVIATTGSPIAQQPAVRRALAALDPQLVMHRTTTLDDAIGRGAAQRRFTLGILGAFAAVALGLAALGLFGVLSYTVRLRSREIGIRIALGADGSAIRRMVLWQGLAVASLGIVLGLIGAVGLSGFMASLVFRVSPLNPGVLGGAAAFMLLVAGLAAYLPARRATILDPRTVLQGE